MAGTDSLPTTRPGSKRAHSRNSAGRRSSVPTVCGNQQRCVGEARLFGHRVAVVRVRQDRHFEDAASSTQLRIIGDA